MATRRPGPGGARLPGGPWLSLEVLLLLLAPAGGALVVGGAAAGALAVVVPGRVARVVRGVVALGTRVAPLPRGRGHGPRVSVAHGRVLGGAGGSRGAGLVPVARRGVPSGAAAAVVAVLAGRGVGSRGGVGVVLLGPQVLLRRLVVVMVRVLLLLLLLLDVTPPAGGVPSTAAVVAGAAHVAARLLEPVGLLLAQVVGFGNQKQITVNLQVRRGQGHARH